MQTVLTSWKDIARYMGKGVRTVQRWEEYFGLPVRRPRTDSHHAVLAIPEEIDAWLRIKTELRNERPASAETDRLREKITQLEEENQLLRVRLDEDVSIGERNRQIPEAIHQAEALAQGESIGQEARVAYRP